MRKFAILCVIMLLAPLVLGGCGSSSANDTSTTDTPAATAAVTERADADDGAVTDEDGIIGNEGDAATGDDATDTAGNDLADGVEDVTNGITDAADSAASGADDAVHKAADAADSAASGMTTDS
ncbi:MAG: hypothetical protein LUC20_06145 [Oscillospiraceae bacterium]|nr:hypothetical protein [Oscillospiraceae bacterium]